MRLFHVSEEPNILLFEPRLPKRTDLDQTVGLVWAIDEKRLPNFLTPRECPRVAYYSSTHTSEADKKRFFSSSNISYAVVIENRWFHTMKNITLYLYEFDTKEFVLQDEVAGYYVAKTAQSPIHKYQLDDLFLELFKRNVELRVTDNLWDIAEAVKASTLCWSLCRMRNASPRP